MAYTFGAQDILATLGITAADWEVQDSGDNRQQDWAGTKDNDGAMVAASETAHNDRSEYTLNLKVKAGTLAAAVTFNLGGAGTSDVVITQFSAKQTYNDLATLSITAHLHQTTEVAAVHGATPVDQGVSLELGFGVLTNYLGGTLKDCQSSELSGSIEHVDKMSNVGKFLVGASTGLKYDCTEEYVDSGSDVTVVAPWKQDSQEKKTGNGDFYTRSVKGHAYSLT